jgi:hypothetical protein
MKGLYTYNFLRELLAKVPTQSLSQLDPQWVKEVYEKIDPYMIKDYCVGSPRKGKISSTCSNFLRIPV